MSDSRLQELIARAVCGRAESRLSLVDVLPTEAAEVLGVRVTGARVRAGHEAHEIRVEIVVEYDCWCADDDSTWITKGKGVLDGPIHLHRLARPLGETELTCKLLGLPSCKRFRLSDDRITVDLSATVLVEQVGMSRFWVKAFDVDDDETEDVEDDED